MNSALVHILENKQGDFAAWQIVIGGKNLYLVSALLYFFSFGQHSAGPKGFEPSVSSLTRRRDNRYATAPGIRSILPQP